MSYLIFCLQLCLANTLHVGHIAEYQYQLHDQDIHLRFVIEKEELMGFELAEDCDVQKMTALCTSLYLKDHAILKINGKKVNFQLQDAVTENDHMIVNFSARLQESTIDQISVENDCFYEFNHKFRNRIIFNFPNYQGSYLLDQNNKSIELNGL